MKGTLYMVPCPIAEGDVEAVLPAANRDILRRIDYFVVEQVRTARRFLVRQRLGRPIEELTFCELNEHTPPEEMARIAAPLEAGRDAAMISEAGVPGVADPGAGLAAYCHRHGIRVRPLVGPSSLLLALMASGMNGQRFAFAGYLPVPSTERERAIRRLEQRACTEKETQIVIETPYRGERLAGELLRVLGGTTLLTIAVDLTGPGEEVLTLPVDRWRRTPLPDLHKRPAVFLIGAPMLLR